MSENKKVRIGMMSFAHMHAGSYASCVNRIPEAELVGIADDNQERGQDMAKRFKTKLFDSYEELLKQNINAVIVCSENIRHKELTIMAAQAGKHILCEKPIATNVADGRAMIEECKKQGVKLMTAFPCRFSPVMVQARQAIMSGQIGKILAIKGANRGKCPGGWFTDLSQSGGGAILNHTVQVADIIRWFTGAEVTDAYAEVSNMMKQGDFDDCGILSITLDSGVFATIDPSWSRPDSFPIWGDVLMAVIGTEGAIWIDIMGQKMNLYSDRTMTGSWECWGSDFDMLMIKSFVDSIANGTSVEVTGEDGLAAVAVALAAYESTKRGEPVRLSEIGF